MDDEWNEKGAEFLSCGIQLVMTGQNNEIEGTCPRVAGPPILANTFYFSTILILLGGIVLQFTDENVKFWKTKWYNCKLKKLYSQPQTSDPTLDQ